MKKDQEFHAAWERLEALRLASGRDEPIDITMRRAAEYLKFLREPDAALKG